MKNQLEIAMAELACVVIDELSSARPHASLAESYGAVQLTLYDLGAAAVVRDEDAGQAALFQVAASAILGLASVQARHDAADPELVAEAANKLLAEAVNEVSEALYGASWGSLDREKSLRLIAEKAIRRGIDIAWEARS